MSKFLEHVKRVIEKNKELLYNGKKRDPDRIPLVMAQLQDMWEHYPDLRLGQLIGNVIREEQRLYAIEDFELIRELRDWYIDNLPEEYK